jgi:CO/xanthine dehydrogenase Mo-binding subunit
MIGAPLTRLGAEPLLTGRGRFVADVRVEGMLEAVVVRSRHAHARLVRIDARRALAMPGIHAVFTAPDVPAASTDAATGRGAYSTSMASSASSPR